MKKIVLLLPAICLVAASFSMSAKADTVKVVTFGDNGPGPLGSDTIGPYTLSVNGKTNVQVFCMDDFLTVSEGESWNVNVVSGDQITGSGKIKDEEAAYIFSELGKANPNGGKNDKTFSDTDVQDALWALFDPLDNVNGGAATLLADAGMVSNYGSVDMNLYDFYIPTGDLKGTQWGDSSTPQTFIGLNPDPSTPMAPTPEPSSLILLGSGLVGMAGAVRRKLSRI